MRKIITTFLLLIFMLTSSLIMLDKISENKVINNSNNLELIDQESNQTPRGLQDNSINNILINGQELSPKFKNEIKSYKFSVNSLVTEVNITVLKGHDGQTVVVSSNANSLKIGDNQIIVKVSSENGLTIDLFSIVVTRGVDIDYTAWVIAVLIIILVIVIISTFLSSKPKNDRKSKTPNFNNIDSVIIKVDKRK